MIYQVSTYDSILKKSYAYTQSEHDSSPAWALIKELYKRNYLDQLNRSDEPITKIPKKIHQIWLGSTFPDRFKKYTESWQKFHPTWEYKLWTDADVKNIYIKRKDLYDKATSQGMKSDILRYEILRQFGGLYVDTDFVCIKPFDDLMFLDFFTSSGYTDYMQLYIGLIACIPNHPIMNKACNSYITKYDGRVASLILNATGANYFTKAFLDTTTKETKGVVAFPTDFFYPFPNNVREEKETANEYITEMTYAVHLWEVSWILGKRRRK